MKNVFIFITVAVAYFLSSCATHDKPFITESESKIDPDIIGIWRTNIGEDQIFYLKIKPRNENSLELTGQAFDIEGLAIEDDTDHKLVQKASLAYVASISGRKVILVKDPSNDRWSYTHYLINDKKDLALVEAVEVEKNPDLEAVAIGLRKSKLYSMDQNFNEGAFEKTKFTEFPEKLSPEEILAFKLRVAEMKIKELESAKTTEKTTPEPVATKRTAKELYDEGVKYYDGEGVDKDLNKAVSLIRESAEMGHADAQNFYGWLIDNGDGVEKNPAEAFTWYLKAADQGLAKSLSNVGICYENGTGVKKDLVLALKYYKQASDEGDPIGLYSLGRCYELGIGVVKDERVALEYYKKASDKGDLTGLYSLGRCYELGIGVVKDERVALEYYKNASDKGSADAMVALGACYGRGDAVEQDWARAARLFARAADIGQGVTKYDAMVRLANCYQAGLGVGKNIEMAVKLYKESALGGDATSQAFYGSCFENGTGVPKDIGQAVYWYRKSSAQGNAYGQDWLGGCFLKGNGVAKNQSEAFRLFTLAGRQGLASAITNQGYCYNYGLGVAKDLDIAWARYKEAAALGDETAKRNVRNHIGSGGGSGKTVCFRCNGKGWIYLSAEGHNDRCGYCGGTGRN